MPITASRGVDIVTIPGLRKALNALPKEAQQELREAANRLVTPMAADARSRAAQEGGLAAIVGKTAKAKKDREPLITLGSKTILPPRTVMTADGPVRRRRKPIPSQRINAVWAGAEFGSDRFTQFKPWTGNDEGAGYFFYPAIRAHGDDVTVEYLKALDKALAAI